MTALNQSRYKALRLFLAVILLFMTINWFLPSMISTYDQLIVYRPLALIPLAFLLHRRMNGSESRFWQRPPFPRLLMLPSLIASLIVLTPIPIGFLLGGLNFTYGMRGFDHPYMRFILPLHFLIMLFANLFGTEPIFRRQWFSLSEQLRMHPAVANLIQAVVAAGSTGIAVRSWLDTAEPNFGLWVITIDGLTALLGGLIFLRQRSIWASALFVTVVSFVRMIVINDIDTGLETAHYYVTASELIPWITIATYFVAGVTVFALSRASGKGAAG